MPGAEAKTAFDPVSAMLAAFDTNQQMNELVLESVAEEAWRAEPPQPPATKKKQGRTIAAIAAHMHNVRLMWLKALKAPSLPEKLDPDKATATQAIKAHRAGHAALRLVLENALGEMDVYRTFRPTQRVSMRISLRMMLIIVDRFPCWRDWRGTQFPNRRRLDYGSGIARKRSNLRE